MWLAAFSSSRVSKKTVRAARSGRSPSTSASSPSREAPSSLATAARRVSAFSSASIFDRPAALELDPQAADDRAVELERHRRGHVPVDPQRIGRRERLLASGCSGSASSPSTVVNSAACQTDDRKSPTSGRCPGPWRWIASNRRSVSAVGAAACVAIRSPRGHGIVLVETADVRDRLPEAVVRLGRLELRVDELGPRRVGRRRDAPVRRAQVDDLADLGQERQEVAAGASAGTIPSSARGACGPQSEIRAARSSESTRSRSSIQAGCSERLGSPCSSRSRLTHWSK